MSLSCSRRLVLLHAFSFFFTPSGRLFSAGGVIAIGATAAGGDGRPRWADGAGSEARQAEMVKMATFSALEVVADACRAPVGVVT